MKSRLLLSAWTLLACITAAYAQPVDAARKAQIEKTQVFIENKGQWDKRVRFLMRSGGLDTWITDRGVVYDVYQLTRSTTMSSNHLASNVQENQPDVMKFNRKSNLPDMTKLGDKTNVQNATNAVDRRGHVVGINFVGASSTTTSHGVERQPGYHNYFIGNDRNKWTSNVALYSSVEIQGLYPGVDAVYYLDGGKPRYDLVIKPGANTSRIRMNVEGAKSVKVSADGSLMIMTTMGAIEQRGLYAYQLADGKRQKVPCAFVVGANRTVTFSVGKHDRTRPLVIDPLVYSTYLGGTGQDGCAAMAVDGSGNAYITGSTYSSDFPTTGAYQMTSAGDNDAFVSKLSDDGSTLVYSTYIGGGGLDQCQAIALDGSGNAVVTGVTYSTDYPTNNAYQALHAGFADVFVTKLNSSGTALEYSTFLGGTSLDVGTSIAVDANGNAYVGCYTFSLNFSTEGVYQSASAGGVDGFIAKFNSNGTISYATYLGGSGQDFVSGIDVDESGNVYVVGYTFSSNFPTLEAFQSSNAGTLDGFAVKLNSDGSDLLYATYLGGTASDYLNDVAVDSEHNVYAVGYTQSSNFPTLNAYQPSKAGGWDACVIKLNSSGSALVYSTYLGGNEESYGRRICLDATGSAYISGFTNSTDFPTHLADQPSFGGTYDAFITKLNSTGNALEYSSYLGGADGDYGFDVAINSTGDILVCGSTASSDFPTQSAFQSSFAGEQDGFVTKISLSNPSVTLTSPNGGEAWCNGTSKNITWTSNDITNVKIELSTNSGSTFTSTIVASTDASAGSYTWSIPANLAAGTTRRIRISDASNAAVNDASDANFTINTTPAPSITGTTTVNVCSPRQIVYSVPAVSGNTFAWVDPQRGDIVGSSSQRTVSIEWKSLGTDTVRMTQTNASGTCSTSAMLVVSIAATALPTNNACIRVTNDDVTCQGADAQGLRKYTVKFTFSNVKVGTNFIRIYEDGLQGSTYTYPFTTTQQVIVGKRSSAQLSLPVVFNIDVYDVLPSGKTEKCTLGYCMYVPCGLNKDAPETTDEEIIAGEQSEAPAVMALVPNPASEVVEILLSIPSYDPSSSLNIVDMNGITVATIATGMAQGSIVIPTQINDLASGTYMVRLQTAGTTVVRQLLIIR